MKVRERIENWLDVGIESTEAIGVRGTSTNRIIGTALFGIQPGKYFVKGEDKLAIPFYPYLDRTQYEGIIKLREGLGLANDNKKYSTKTQIKDNLEGYASEHASSGSPELGFINFQEFDARDLIALTEPLGQEHRLKLSKKTGLETDKIDWIIEMAKRRKGVQFALSVNIFKDFKVWGDDPQDSYIYEFNMWPSQSYISGISIRTDFELEELRKLADECDANQHLLQTRK